MPVLRRHATAALANAIWNSASTSQVESSRRCPSCSRPLKTFEVEDRNGSTELDGCTACQFLWFDSNELKRLGIELGDPTPESKRRALAELEVQSLRERNEAAMKPVDTILDLWLWL